MSHFIPKPGLRLRLIKKSTWQPPVCLFQARRAFATHPRREYPKGGNVRMNMNHKKAPPRPSIASAQSKAMRNMRKEDIPDNEMLIKITYILPSGPKIWVDPLLRSKQLWQWLKQSVREWPQAMLLKFRFWSDVPRGERPENTKIDLQLLRLNRIVKDLHKGSYKALEDASNTGDMQGLKNTCGNTLRESYMKRAAKGRNARRVVKWDVSYPLFGTRILSRNFAQLPLEFNGLPMGIQQVVARVHSKQTLTAGTYAPTGNKGAKEVQWHESKARDLIETIVLQRIYLSGAFEPWKVITFVTPDSTKEGLLEWQERQLTVHQDAMKGRASTKLATS